MPDCACGFGVPFCGDGALVTRGDSARGPCLLGGRCPVSGRPRPQAPPTHALCSTPSPHYRSRWAPPGAPPGQAVTARAASDVGIAVAQHSEAGGGCAPSPWLHAPCGTRAAGPSWAPGRRSVPAAWPPAPAPGSEQRAPAAPASPCRASTLRQDTRTVQQDCAQRTGCSGCCCCASGCCSMA